MQFQYIETATNASRAEENILSMLRTISGPTIS